MSLVRQRLIGRAEGQDSAMNSTEHKVKRLCARVIGATDEDFYSALAELRSFLRSHSEILQNATVASILGLSLSNENDSRAEAPVSS